MFKCSCIFELLGYNVKKTRKEIQDEANTAYDKLAKLA